jgi:hypothetical protein
MRGTLSAVVIIAESAASAMAVPARLTSGDETSLGVVVMLLGAALAAWQTSNLIYNRLTAGLEGAGDSFDVPIGSSSPLFRE